MPHEKMTSYTFIMNSSYSKKLVHTRSCYKLNDLQTFKNYVTQFIVRKLFIKFDTNV